MDRWMRFCRDFRVKLICSILLIASVVTTVGSLQWFLNYMSNTEQSGEVIFDDYNRSYIETSGFKSEFSDTVRHIAQYTAAKAIFETKGKFDEDKVVDLKRFYDEGIIDGKAENGVSFTIGDLIRMGERWYDSDEGTQYETIFVCQKKVKSDEPEYDYLTESEFNKLMQNEYNDSEYDYDGSTGAVYDENGNRIYRDCWELEIPYMTVNPIEGEWLDIFNQNPELNGTMNDYSEMFSEAVSNIYNYYSCYKNGNSYADGTKTNVIYFLYNPDTKQIFSNNPNWSDRKKVEEYMEEIKKQDTYLSWDSGRVESSLGGDDTADFWGYGPEDVSYAGTTAWTGGFTIDPTFETADDVFAKQSTLYGRYASMAEIVRAVLGGSIVVLILSIILLTFGLGVSGDGEVKLFAFDKLKTEIAAVIVLGIWGIIFGSGVAFIAEFNELLDSYIFWGVVLSFPSAVLFLIGYDSLLKRLRAHTFWKNSLCFIVWGWLKKIAGEIMRFAKELSHNINLVWKTVGLAAAVIFLHWIAMADDSGFFIFVAVIVEIVLFIQIVRRAIGEQVIMNSLRDIVAGKLEQKIDTGKMKGAQKEAAELLNHVEDGLEEAMMKQMKSERMKTELITNVSHDIKTPLTSIINYVDLLKRETAEFDKADPKKVEEYLEVLDQKSQRLKVLTEDVVEASKISSGNISLENTRIDLVESLIQIEAEYSEKLLASGLKIVKTMPEPPVMIYADGRRIWRVFGNLYQNTAKYAMPDTRVYVDLVKKDGKAIFTMKNISEAPLNINADELTERFIRGDESRTTEGSGLGLSIAKSLTEAMKGKFEIYLDGDLFKVIVEFPICE